MWWRGPCSRAMMPSENLSRRSSRLTDARSLCGNQPSLGSRRWGAGTDRCHDRATTTWRCARRSKEGGSSLVCIYEPSSTATCASHFAAWLVERGGPADEPASMLRARAPRDARLHRSSRRVELRRVLTSSRATPSALRWVVEAANRRPALAGPRALVCTTTWAVPQPSPTRGVARAVARRRDKIYRRERGDRWWDAAVGAAARRCGGAAGRCASTQAHLIVAWQACMAGFALSPHQTRRLRRCAKASGTSQLTPVRRAQDQSDDFRRVKRRPRGRDGDEGPWRR